MQKTKITLEEKLKNKQEKIEYKKVKKDLPKISGFKSFMLFVAFLFVAISAITQTYLTTIIFQSLVEQNFKKFLMWFLIELTILISWLITKFYSEYFLEKECEILKTKMRKYIFKSYASEAGQKKISKEPGTFKSITIDNVEKYVDGYIKSKYKNLMHFTQVILSIAFLIYISWILGLIAIGLSLIAILLGAITSPPISKAQNKYVGQLNKFNDDISTNIDAHSVFYLNNSTNKIVTFLSSRFRWIENKYIKFYIKNISFQIPSLFLMIIIQIGIFGIASIFVVKGMVAVSALAAVGFLTGAFTNEMFMLLEGIKNMARDIKLFHYFVPTVEKAKESKYIKQINSIIVKDYNIEFEDKKLFKKKFNQTFEQGKRYVIVGDSGSGKSTLINSILGKQKNYEGIIKFGKHNTKDISIKSFAENIGILNSTPYVFKATLFENITIFDDTIKLQKVQKLLDAINFNEMELNKEIDINSISEGQKQKINFLRVMLRNPQWVISDEGFSNVDKESRKNILKYISEQYKGGVISITHHLNKKEEVIYDSKITF
ncbi:MAG: ABC transporter ATP-binding protein [Mycoplasmatales bacterium]|nr:ABC transporter ATP-binding protein [Mycoplasmatales bacterium]